LYHDTYTRLLFLQLHLKGIGALSQD